jgi:hypothetical protein
MASPPNLAAVPVMTYEYYSTSHRVNNSGHPLNRKLGGSYRSPIPQIPWDTGYVPINLDTT